MFDFAKLASRKLAVAVVAMGINAWAVYSGLIDGASGMRNVVYLAGVYILGQSFVDSKAPGKPKIDPNKLGNLMSLAAGFLAKPDKGKDEEEK